MSEGFLLKPSGDRGCGVRREIKDGTCVFDDLFARERFQIQFRVKPRSWVGESFCFREKIRIGRKADAVIEHLDAEQLELISEDEREVSFADAGDVLEVIHEEHRAFQSGAMQEAIPGIRERVPKERGACTEKTARRLAFERDGTEMGLLKPPILKLGAQSTLQVGVREQSLREFIKQDFGKSQIVVNIARC